MKKQTVYLILIFLYFGCSQENILPDNPIPDEKAVGAVEIEIENQIVTTFALTNTSANGYAITGLKREDEISFYPFYASISEDLQVEHFQSPIGGKLRDYGSDIIEAGGNFFIVTYNYPSDWVYELEGIGLTKLNQEGNSIWHKEYFHNISFEGVRNELKFYEDKLYLIGNSITDERCFIARFDLDGNLLDQFDFQSLNYASNLILNESISFFASKSEYKQYTDGREWTYTPYIVRTNFNGNILWETPLDPSRGYPTRARIVSDQNDNFVVVHTRRVLRSQIYRYYLDLSYVSNSGEHIWTKVLNNIWPEYTYLSLGCVANNSSGEIFVFVTDKSNGFPILLKYGADGSILQKQVFAEFKDILMTDMVLGDDGMLVVVGTHASDGRSYIIRISQDLEIQ